MGDRMQTFILIFQCFQKESQRQKDALNPSKVWIQKWFKKTKNDQKEKRHEKFAMKVNESAVSSNFWNKWIA